MDGLVLFTHAVALVFGVTCGVLFMGQMQINRLENERAKFRRDLDDPERGLGYYRGVRHPLD